MLKNVYIVDSLYSSADASTFIQTVCDTGLSHDDTRAVYHVVYGAVAPPSHQLGFILQTKVGSRVHVSECLQYIKKDAVSGEMIGLIFFVWASYVIYPPDVELVVDESLPTRPGVTVGKLLIKQIVPDTQRNRTRAYALGNSGTDYLQNLKRDYDLMCQAVSNDIPHIVLLAHDGELVWDADMVAETRQKTSDLLNLAPETRVSFCNITDKTESRQVIFDLFERMKDFPNKAEYIDMIRNADGWLERAMAESKKRQSEQ
jgi:hypothetical protein